MRVEIIAVGSELLTDARTETDSLLIARRLREYGLSIARKAVVGDAEAEIAGALRIALQGAQVVILVGGLGPTNDDLTREVVARELGRTLELDDEVLEGLKRRYRKVSLKVGEGSLRQAMVPQGGQVIQNRNGTAPGLFLKEAETLIFLLPGPPRELKPMLGDVVKKIGEYLELVPAHQRTIRVASMAESVVDEMVGPIYESYSSIDTTILSSPGIVELLCRWAGPNDPQLAEEQLDELVGRVDEKLGLAVFTHREENLQEVLGNLLGVRGLTVATAESCTGGLLGQMLTEVPGSSRYFRGGVVCYSNDLKVELLGVNETTLERFGAVSEEVASQMAGSIRRIAGADYGISVTGIAGPEGGSQAKPVGLVYLGLASQEATEVKKLQWVPPREAIRRKAAQRSLDWLRRTLMESD